MSACFLDTCAVIDLFRRRESARNALAPFDNLLLGCVALGELFTGAMRSANVKAEVERMQFLLSDVQTVRVDAQTAYIYGELSAELEQRGERIPMNDLWIAALCVQFDLPLVTRDDHFARLSQVRLALY